MKYVIADILINWLFLSSRTTYKSVFICKWNMTYFNIPWKWKWFMLLVNLELLYVVSFSLLLWPPPPLYGSSRSSSFIIVILALFIIAYVHILQALSIIPLTLLSLVSFSWYKTVVVKLRLMSQIWSMTGCLSATQHWQSDWWDHQIQKLVPWIKKHL